MRQITLAVLIVFIFSMLANYKVILLVITGFASAVISLNVNTNVQGIITSFTYPLSVAVNNPMDFSVSFKNVGNVNITEKIIIFIKSADLQTSAILKDDTFTLDMGEIRIFNTTYTPTSGGNFFAFVVVTYDNKTAEANASFTVNVPSPIVTPTVGGVGGIAALPTVTEINTISKITPYEIATVKIEQEDKLKIQTVEIETKSTAVNVQISVKESSLPIGANAPITADKGSVLKYLEISKTNLKDEAITKTKIRFKVDKSWINANAIDAGTVSLQRFDKNWEKLPTSKINEDSSFFYYEVGSAGLSLYAITGEKRILALEYPEYLKLNRGQSSLIQIFVRNDGNADLNNLVLFTSDSGLSLELNPTSLSTLPPNSSFIFLVSVKVPRETPAGIYPIDFTLASDRITKKGQIKVEVEVQKIEVEVEQSIKNYESSIEKLFVEIDKATKEGRNTSLAIESLNQAKAELEIAKNFYNSQDFVKSKGQLENVRKLIEQATVQLAQTVGPKIIFVPIPLPRPEIVASAAGTGGLSVYYYYRKKKEEESYRKSIRKAIQIINSRGEGQNG